MVVMNNAPTAGHITQKEVGDFFFFMFFSFLSFFVKGKNATTGGSEDVNPMLMTRGWHVSTLVFLFSILFRRVQICRWGCDTSRDVVEQTCYHRFLIRKQIWYLENWQYIFMANYCPENWWYMYDLGAFSLPRSPQCW